MFSCNEFSFFRMSSSSSRWMLNHQFFDRRLHLRCAFLFFCKFPDVEECLTYQAYIPPKGCVILVQGGLQPLARDSKNPLERNSLNRVNIQFLSVIILALVIFVFSDTWFRSVTLCILNLSSDLWSLWWVLHSESQFWFLSQGCFFYISLLQFPISQLVL